MGRWKDFDDRMTFGRLCVGAGIFCTVILVVHLAACWVAGQEITRASDAPIPIGRIEFLDVGGISLDQFDNAKVRVYPPGYDVDLRTMYDRGPDGFRPVLLLRANEAPPGAHYDLAVVYPVSETEVGLIEYPIDLESPPEPVDPDPVDPPVPNEKAAKATYIYEKDYSLPPPEVSKALMDLNESGVVATEIDQDVDDGTGEVPDQYRKSIEAISGLELPALVVQNADGDVIAVIQNPSPADIEALK